MAIIIETCPKCGHDLVDVMLASNPPIPKKECWNCGWSWTGEQEEVVRIPFGGNSLKTDENEYLNYHLNCTITEKEIQDRLASVIKTTNTNTTKKYVD